MPRSRAHAWAAIARAMGKADATRPEDFLAALAEMQQACGVDTLRLADYGVREEDCGKIAENAVVTMGGLFRRRPAQARIRRDRGHHPRIHLIVTETAEGILVLLRFPSVRSAVQCTFSR